MAEKLKEFLVNSIGVSVLTLLAALVIDWTGKQFSWLTKIVVFGGMGWTGGFALSIGVAVLVLDMLKQKFPALK